MARIYLRGKMYYSDFSFFENGKRHRVNVALDTDKKLAYFKMLQMMKEKDDKKRGKIPDATALDAFIENYLKVRASKVAAGQLGKASLTKDRNHIGWMKKRVQLRYLQDITPHLLEHDLKEGMLEDEFTGNTINTFNASIITMMHYAESKRLIHQQNWKEVKKLRGKERADFLTPEQLAVLFQKAHGLWQTVCKLGAYAGLRREEIRMLRLREDVSFDNNVLIIQAHDGWAPKNQVNATVPIFPPLREHLLKLRKNPKSKWAIGDGTWRPSLHRMSIYITQLIRATGNKTCSLHSLRHTFGSYLAMGGYSAKKVKEVMRHQSITQTDKYMHLAPSSVQDMSNYMIDVENPIAAPHFASTLPPSMSS